LGALLKEKILSALGNGRWAFGFLLAYCLLPTACCQSKTSISPHFIIETATPADEQRLTEVFEVLERARNDLLRMGYQPPARVKLVVHPDLKSFLSTTQLPWFVLAVADQKQSRIDVQRLRIVAEKGLEATLRHELFHLAQPEGWPRWKAEGMAMRFAGQKPRAKPLDGLSEARLDALLAYPPDQEVLSRAMATAFLRTQKIP
jgi:hypothetical protein